MKLHLVTAALLILATAAPAAAGRSNLRRRHLNNLAAFQEDVVDVSFAWFFTFLFCTPAILLIFSCDDETKSHNLLLAPHQSLYSPISSPITTQPPQTLPRILTGPPSPSLRHRHAAEVRQEMPRREQLQVGLRRLHQVLPFFLLRGR